MLSLQHSVGGVLFEALPPCHQVHLLGRLDQLLLLEHLHISQQTALAWPFSYSFLEVQGFVLLSTSTEVGQNATVELGTAGGGVVVSLFLYILRVGIYCGPLPLVLCLSLGNRVQWYLIQAETLLVGTFFSTAVMVAGIWNGSTLDVVWIWLWIDPATALYVVGPVKVAWAAWLLTGKQTSHALVVLLAAVLAQAAPHHLLATNAAEVEVLP